jgi:hypothetical protein
MVNIRRLEACGHLSAMLARTIAAGAGDLGHASRLD